MKTKILGFIITVFFLIFMACGQQKEKTETTTEKTGTSTEQTMNKPAPEKSTEQSSQSSEKGEPGKTGEETPNNPNGDTN